MIYLELTYEKERGRQKIESIIHFSRAISNDSKGCHQPLQIEKETARFIRN